ncbi:M4 family metallopeptidase [Clostridium paridis]|uniref:M4 family metallopeptidase n=1 Tax=Clostridium paridis TaxID=2803863 RepID=A0A937K4K2_9CLOT|nr:M4 family metallopeptidase [Clostridium paridis]MBL4931964.1 M4 family metallopeptidase [Clostridium paridis]
MKKKILSFLLSITVICSVPISISAKEVTTTTNLGEVQTSFKLANGKEGSIRLNRKNGQVFLSGKLSDKQVPGEKSALKFLDDNKALLGIDSTSNDLKIADINKDKNGDTYVKFAQIINGVKVNNSIINVHFDKDGVISSINGKLQKNKTITTLGSKKVSEGDAIEVAKKQYKFKSLRNTPSAEKLIITKDDKNYEVYKVNISYKEPTIGNYDVYIEANSGQVIQSDNNIRYDGPVTGSGIDVLGKTKSLNLYQSGTSYQMKDITKSSTSEISTYSLNNGTTTGTLVSNSTNYFGTEPYKASVSAEYNASKVIDFYKNLFIRNSLDNKGMAIESYTHYGTQYNNAFWDGYEMVYGDGDGTTFTYLSGDLDVVGHEMTHGVISNTANLSYHNQSGALNESLADTFGVLISTYDKYNVAAGGTWAFNSSDWVVGDDIYTPNIPGDALRSLSNPTKYGQPDNMSNYKSYSDTEAGDWGGVHTNSGIPNKAAYLIAQSIGMEKTARIYYRAITSYMNADTDFAQEKNSLIQAATDLYGANSGEISAINSAFSAIGIGTVTVDDPYEPNDSIVTAYPINMGTSYNSYISTSSDEDYYKFNVNTVGNIRISMANLPQDYDLELYDANGSLVGYSTGSGTANEVINYNATNTGTYYIHVYSYSGYSTSQKYSLIVSRPVTGITLDKTSGSLKAGETLTLTPIISPIDATNRNVSWTSSNSLVAKVDSFGKVYPVGNGTAIITATTADGNYKATCTITITTLEAPLSLSTKSISYDTINISWGAVNGASGYEIYRSSSSVGTYSYLTSTTALSYNNTGLLTNSTYYYKVRAYKLVGTAKVYSDFSTVVSAKPILSTPLNISLTSINYRSFKIAWSGVSGANGYMIYRATPDHPTYSLIASTAYLNYTDSGLTLGKTYYYKLRAYKKVGTTFVYSDWSKVVYRRR